MGQPYKPKVLIIGDWDADGVIAAAEISYAQETLGVFPVKGRAEVELRPAGPRSFQAALTGGCWDYLVILDIPFTQDVEAALKALFDSGCRPKIYYFDHHKVTLEKATYIEETFDATTFIGVSPTSILVKAFLEGLGVRLTPRLRDLVASMAVLESGGWLGRREGQVPEGVVKIAASISKTINQSKDPELWRRYVKWASSVLPFEPSSLAGEEDLVAKGLTASAVSDHEIRDVARTLAMEARTVGFVKFVDARGKWNKSGASALASAIFRITKMTTVLLVSKGDGTNIVIVRGVKGDAMRLMESLYRLGVVEDVGGHENIASGRLKQGIGIKELEDALRRASLELR